MLTVSKAWRRWQPEGLPAFCSLSLYLSCAKHTQTHMNTHTHMCTNTRPTHCTDTCKQKKKPPHKKESALSQTSASQLASALVSPRKRIIFQLDAFSLFIVSRPKPYQQLITACQIHRLTAVTLRKKRIQWIIFSSSDCHFRFGQSPISFRSSNLSNSQGEDQHLFDIICCDMLIASTCNSL